MRVFSTIVILFLSCIAMAQNKPMETVLVSKTVFQEVKNSVSNCEITTVKESTSLNTAISGLNKNVVNGFTEHLLFNLKLVLPNNLIWLHNSIALLDSKIRLKIILNQEASLELVV